MAGWLKCAGSRRFRHAARDFVRLFRWTITRETWLKPFSPIPEEARKQIESSLIGMTFHTDRGPMENEKPIAATILTAVAVAIAVWATIGAPPLHPQYGVKRVVASRP
jgi:hypothetical protein